MALEKPALATVSAGEPVTAQGWNAIVGGLSDLYDAVLALGGEAVAVNVKSEGEPVAAALVVATPLNGGQPVLGIPPHGKVETYLVSGLTPGAWRLHAAAPGYEPGVADIEVPTGDTVQVDLEPTGAVMPDLFGLPAPEAVAELKSRDIQIDRIIDITGQDLPPGRKASDFDNAPVLLQLPDAGQIVPPKFPVRLVLAASLRPEAVVEVPNLRGLTLTEATAVLEDLGLVFGGANVLD